MALFGLVAAVAMLAMVVGFGVARPPGYSQWLLSDQSFISRANAVCRASLPGLRTAGQVAMTTSGPAPPTPTALDVQAGGVDALANQLAALPINASDKSHVDGWLTGWHNWASDQRAYAGYVSSHPGSAFASVAAGANASSKANQLQAMAKVEAAAADHFAIANGLVYCTLSPAPATSQPPAETSTGSQRNSPTSAVTAPTAP